MGRGGRVILDRISTNMDSYWENLDYKIFDSEKNKNDVCNNINSVSVNHNKNFNNIISNINNDESSCINSRKISNLSINNNSSNSDDRFSFLSDNNVNNSNYQNNNNINMNVIKSEENSNSNSTITTATVTTTPLAATITTTIKTEKLFDYEQLIDESVKANSMINNNYDKKYNDLYHNSNSNDSTSMRALSPKTAILSSLNIKEKILNDSLSSPTIATNTIQTPNLSSNNEIVNPNYINNSSNSYNQDFNSSHLNNNNSSNNNSNVKLSIDNDNMNDIEYKTNILHSNNIIYNRNDNDIHKTDDIFMELLSEMRNWNWPHFHPKAPECNPEEDETELIFDSDVSHLNELSKITVELQTLDDELPTSIFNENDNNLFSTDIFSFDNLLNDTTTMSSNASSASSCSGSSSTKSNNQMEKSVSTKTSIPGVLNNRNNNRNISTLDTSSYLAASDNNNLTNSNSKNMISLNSVNLGINESNDDDQQLLENLLQECQTDNFKTLNQTSKFWNGLLNDDQFNSVESDEKLGYMSELVGLKSSHRDILHKNRNLSDICNRKIGSSHFKLLNEPISIFSKGNIKNSSDTDDNVSVDDKIIIKKEVNLDDDSPVVVPQVNIKTEYMVVDEENSQHQQQLQQPGHQQSQLQSQTQQIQQQHQQIITTNHKFKTESGTQLANHHYIVQQSPLVLSAIQQSSLMNSSSTPTHMTTTNSIPVTKIDNAIVFTTAALQNKKMMNGPNENKNGE